MVTDSFLSLSLYVEKLKSLLTALGKHLMLWQGGVLEPDENWVDYVQLSSLCSTDSDWAF